MMSDENQIVEKVIKHLETSLFNDIKEKLHSEIRQLVQETVKDEFKEFHQAFSRLERTLDYWKTDLDADRENLSNTRRNTGQIAVEMQEVSKAIENLPKKVENTVKDTMKDTIPQSIADEVPKAITNTFDIVSKKVQVIRRSRDWFFIFKPWKWFR